jgi:predicted amidohydrolase
MYNTEENGSEAGTVVALIQFCAGNKKESNWLTCERLIRKAVRENNEVQLVCLPENFSFMGSNRYESVAAAEPLFLSPTLAKYQALAHELGESIFSLDTNCCS